MPKMLPQLEKQVAELRDDLEQRKKTTVSKNEDAFINPGWSINTEDWDEVMDALQPKLEYPWQFAELTETDIRKVWELVIPDNAELLAFSPAKLPCSRLDKRLGLVS